MSNIPTPHINCTDKSKIAKTVLMPGDPLRAKFIADTYLKNVEVFNNVRGNIGYTGEYNGKKISVMASGMGMASIGIYSYELYKFYDVENIVRIGTAGSYSAQYNIYDLVLVTKSYSNSKFAKDAFDISSKTLTSSKALNNKIIKNAKNLNINIKTVTCESTDVFYGKPNHWIESRDKNGCDVVEMESFALFANAKGLGKKAACILTISDSFVTGDNTSSSEREKGLKKMIELALSLAE